MRSLLITGSSGFIGSNPAVALASQGHQVTCFDNLSRRGSELLLQRIQEHDCRFVHGDIRNIEDLQRIPGSFDVMLECSAEPSVLVGTQGADAAFLLNNNLLNNNLLNNNLLNNNLVGSLNCFEYARQRHIAVLFLSTSCVYPYTTLNALRYVEVPMRYAYADDHPGVSAQGVATSFPLTGSRSLYGASKLASEYILQEYAAQYDLPCLINRCGVVAGDLHP